MSTQSTETEDASRIYYPTYELHEGLTAGTAAWLSDQQGDGPLAIEDVTDVCATFHVRALLRDRAGFLRGRVDERGDYSMGGS